MGAATIKDLTPDMLRQRRSPAGAGLS